MTVTGGAAPDLDDRGLHRAAAPAAALCAHHLALPSKPEQMASRAAMNDPRRVSPGTGYGEVTLTGSSAMKVNARLVRPHSPSLRNATSY